MGQKDVRRGVARGVQTRVDKASMAWFGSIFTYARRDGTTFYNCEMNDTNCVYKQGNVCEKIEFDITTGKLTLFSEGKVWGTVIVGHCV